MSLVQILSITGTRHGPLKTQSIIISLYLSNRLIAMLFDQLITYNLYIKLKMFYKPCLQSLCVQESYDLIKLYKTQWIWKKKKNTALYKVPLFKLTWPLTSFYEIGTVVKKKYFKRVEKSCSWCLRPLENLLCCHQSDDTDFCCSWMMVDPLKPLTEWFSVFVNKANSNS